MDDRTAEEQIRFCFERICSLQPENLVAREILIEVLNDRDVILESKKHRSYMFPGCSNRLRLDLVIEYINETTERHPGCHFVLVFPEE